MRIKKDTLDVVTREYVGEETLPVIEFLVAKENISEFVIATKTKNDIHYIRHVMYKLNNHNLATYTRKKDRVKGWYISYWTLNNKRFKEMFEEHNRNKVDRLKEKLKKEEDCRDGLFICPALCTRMSLEEAMEIEFKCPECGRILAQQDNTRTIEHLREMLENMGAVV